MRWLFSELDELRSLAARQTTIASRNLRARPHGTATGVFATTKFWAFIEVEANAARVPADYKATNVRTPTFQNPHLKNGAQSLARKPVCNSSQNFSLSSAGKCSRDLTHQQQRELACSMRSHRCRTACAAGRSAPRARSR